MVRKSTVIKDGMLKRRGIHDRNHNQNTSSEEHSSDSTEASGNSPEKYAKMYPDIPDLEEKLLFGPDYTFKEQLDNHKQTFVKDHKKRERLKKDSQKKENMQSLSDEENLRMPSEDGKSMRKYIFIIVIIITIISISYFYLNFSKPASLELDLPKLISDLKREFGSQTEKSYLHLKLALKNVMKATEPDKPSMIMLPFVKDTENITHQFAARVAEKINRNYVTIKGEELKFSEPHDAKMKIDGEIRAHFYKGDINVLIVNRLQDIPGEAAMIFHSYCDHENAPFKQSIYLMTVLSGEDVPKNSEFWSSIVEKCLNEAWRSVHEDQRLSLINRLNDWIVSVFPA